MVAGDDVYGGTFRILDKVIQPLGIETTWLDLTDPSGLEAAIRPNTRMLFLETPTNPMLKLVDLEAATAIREASRALRGRRQYVCDAVPPAPPRARRRRRRSQHDEIPQRVTATSSGDASS